MIPGGTVKLGWSGSLELSAEEEADWQEQAEEGLALPDLITPALSSARMVELAPFLLEVEARRVEGWLEELQGADLLTDIATRIRHDGYRLPTDDEWEHAFRGGTTKLFPWGDEWPDGVPHGRETSFVGHRVPNAFGLTFAGDPYQVEVVEEPRGFRGGDGGVAICGGRPWPEPWFALMCAFRSPRADWEDVVYESLENGWVRRALDVPGSLRS